VIDDSGGLTDDLQASLADREAQVDILPEAG
jgi:hypothetical protein